MDLSIIIVSYNVEYFLYQCLNSVSRATKKINAEIIVVDNNSGDDSIKMIKEHYPNVRLIENTKNIGFGRANNQAISIAKGKYTLLLNPDTIVQETTFTKCIEYLNVNKQVGSLGVKMVDGQGQFLPESKRSFPSPSVAFYKLFGFSKIFPKSKIFGKYHLGYLNKNRNHYVDVLSGAFLMTRTKLLQNLNGFDKDYFMYGEDIDLSFRLQQIGLKNVYFAQTEIIHYKGESTKKGSLNYVRHFYNAMIIFAKKHYSSNKANAFVSIMKGAIWAHALFTILKNGLERVSLFIIDLLACFVGMLLFKEFWELLQPTITAYPLKLITLIFPIYSVLMVVALYFSGAQDRPYQFSKIIRGVLIGVFLNAIIYAFLPETLRFSRMLVLLTGVSSAIAVIAVRMAIQYSQHRTIQLHGNRLKHILIVGSKSSLTLKSKHIFPIPEFRFLGLVSNDQTKFTLGNINSLAATVNQLKPTDILFDCDAVDYTTIIDTISLFNKKRIQFHTSSNNGAFIISSSSKNLAGKIIDPSKNYRIAYPEERRKKRLFDVCISTISLLLLPITLWFFKNKSQLIHNSFNTLIGKKTWIGYSNIELPKLKPHVLEIAQNSSHFRSKSVVEMTEKAYAKHYTVYDDLRVLQNQINRLDQN